MSSVGDDMKIGKILAGMAAIILLSSCGTNFKGVPFGSSRYVHSKEAAQFLQEPPDRRIDRDLSQYSLPSRDMAADGQLIGLSISGGGMRASAFALGVLAELDEIDAGNRTVLETVDFVNSISGGSWATAAVLANGGFVGRGKLHQDYTDLRDRFAALDTGRRQCWADRLIEGLTLGKTYGDIYRSGGSEAPPAAFINATLVPSHAPFVFTDGFIWRYQVGGFSAPCVEGYRPNSQTEPVTLAKVPIGLAAAASSAVPAFTKAYAYTSLCLDESRNYSFCYPGKPSIYPGRNGEKRDFLQLMDGGLYDNVGFKNAYELTLEYAKKFPPKRYPALNRAIIFINSAETIDHDTVRRIDADNNRLFELALAASFPNQNATFLRLRRPMFESTGFSKQVLLDFLAVSGFNDTQVEDVRDLPELVSYAARYTSCYGRDGAVKAQKGHNRPRQPIDVGAELARLRSFGGDCLSENFARIGYLHKTTYAFDDYFFDVRYQLGRLAVRMKRDEIVAALKN